MVDRIGGQSSLARAAIEAALARQTEAARKASALPAFPAVSPASAVTAPAQAGAAARTADPADLARSLSDGLRAIDGQVARADRLAEDVVTGKVTDFHEAAAVLKQSELSLRFALEVRNKFVDAYREIMRMSV